MRRKSHGVSKRNDRSPDPVSCILAVLPGVRHEPQAVPAGRRDLPRAASPPPPCAQEAAPDEASTLDTLIVTGTRVADRTVAESQSPIDIITPEVLQATGTTELATALARALPSLNFPRPAITDGTDAVRPAQLRGLSPDQVLVLVNGKRYHTARAGQRQRHARAAARRRSTSTRSRCRRSSASKCCATAPRRNTAPTRSPA